ncbi:IclR family transcriptional regulator [Peribacillus butanolivorans]|uniref:IclR family transcriptional regulator n=1 Tax=Peribacillus butanolivorans TaxID=421767 RepID=A0ABN5N908_9BACI|nr:IclR family transcriptional regulator [Peribacillus butanolivorans]AXN40832.1 IclR family transcriptional regulator [Peribacillus butanolivorans]MCO0600780.1 IclR family transcriptional regulator [Peribacillus butanolivorans]
MNDIKKDYTIQTVQNAMQILRLFTVEKREWTLSEIAEKKTMSISTTKRLLKVLENYRYLERRSGTKKYRLGLSILRLSGIVTTTMEIHREAQSSLKKLVNDFGEAVHIGILEGTETVYLDKMESLHPVRLSSHTGKNNPAYCTGCGKVILAFKEHTEQEEIIKTIELQGFYQFGSKTVRNARELKSHLNQIKKQGYAVCIDEFSEGITSIAAPVYDYNESVVASISITGPNNRIDIPLFVEGVVKAGKDISESLGYIY